MKIKGNKWLISREKPEKMTKYEVIDPGAAHLVKTQKKKLYEYYICDFCGAEIKIVPKWEEKTGGVIKLPTSLTQTVQEYRLALCNKCVRPVIKEFEEGGINSEK